MLSKMLFIVGRKYQFRPKRFVQISNFRQIQSSYWKVFNLHQTNVYRFPSL